MNSTLPAQILKRLIYSKYLFRHGCELLERSSPLAEGMAVLCFQDAVEMMLRTVAEHVGAHIGEQDGFQSLFNKIDVATQDKGLLVPDKSMLFQLNKARNNFKHWGLMPVKSDALKFRNDLEITFTKLSSMYFASDFSSVSFADLVYLRRVHNLLVNAESFFEKEAFAESVICVAKAFKIILNVINVHDHLKDVFSTDSFGNTPRDLHEFSRYFSEMIDVINSHSDSIKLLAIGVNLPDYERFVEIAPYVTRFANNKFQVIWKHESKNISREEALFCLRFTTDSALLVQEHAEFSNRRTRVFLNCHRRLFRVVKSVPILVWASPDSEIIRFAEIGEVLSGYFTNDDKAEFYSLFIDYDVAYILKEAAELICI